MIAHAPAFRPTQQSQSRRAARSLLGESESARGLGSGSTGASRIIAYARCSAVTARAASPSSSRERKYGSVKISRTSAIKAAGDHLHSVILDRFEQHCPPSDPTRVQLLAWLERHEGNVQRCPTLVLHLQRFYRGVASSSKSRGASWASATTRVRCRRGTKPYVTKALRILWSQSRVYYQRQTSICLPPCFHSRQRLTSVRLSLCSFRHH
jgi:hypothetical protein